MGAADRRACAPARPVGARDGMRMGGSFHHELAFAHRKNDRLPLRGRQSLLSHRRDPLGDACRICHRRRPRLCRRAFALVERDGKKGARTLHSRPQCPAENRTRTSHHHLVRDGKRGDRLHDRPRRHHCRNAEYALGVCIHRFQQNPPHAVDGRK